MNDTFAEKLAYLRAQKGMTQRELAALTGIAWSMISKYESGKSKPRLKVLLRLEEALGCAGELTGGDEIISMKVPAELHNQIAEEAAKAGMSIEVFSGIMLQNFVEAAMDETLGITPPRIFTEEKVQKAQSRMQPGELQSRREKRLKEMSQVNAFEESQNS